MLENLGSKVHEAYDRVVEAGKDTLQFVRDNASPKAIGTLVLGGLAYGASEAAAQTGMRFGEIDVDPAAIGYAGETIEMNDFKVRWVRTADPNVFGYVVQHKTHPQNYVTTRGTVTINDGETGSVDGVGALPADQPGSDLGSLAANAEVPGSAAGRDLDAEVNSSLGFGVDVMLTPQTGERVFHVDLESNLYTSQIDALDNTRDAWNDGGTRMVTSGYNSSEGDPTGWAPGQLKVWKVVGVDTNEYNGQIDIANATIRLAINGATQAVIDEEVFSAMFGTPASPFANQALPVIPETYKRLFDIQNFSEILDNGTPVPGFRFGGAGFNRQLYAHGADDGSGVFPGTIVEDDIVQEWDLDANGYALAFISEPVIPNEERSWGDVKAMFR